MRPVTCSKSEPDRILLPREKKSKTMKKLTIHLPETVDEQVARMLIAATFYDNSLLSSEQAAALAGLSREQFLEEVRHTEVSILEERGEGSKH
jgi:predicted HTH domain antitoxin